MTLEAFFQDYGDTLQYLAYFGLLAALCGLEAIVPQRREGANRRHRWPANFALTALNVVVLGALPLTGAGVALLAQEQGWGLLRPLALPAAGVLAVTLGVRSLISYATHVAMHQVPILWRVHRVHHTDTMLDVSTTVRFHPLEFVIQIVPTALAILLVGLPAWSIAAYELVDTTMNLFIHANVRLPAGVDAILRLLFATPDLHRVHHSADVDETNSNYGVVLSLWDRLFHTYRARPAMGHDAMLLGLEGYRDSRTRSFGWLLMLPVDGGFTRPAHAV